MLCYVVHCCGLCIVFIYVNLYNYYRTERERGERERERGHETAVLTLKHPTNRLPNDPVENLFDSGFNIYSLMRSL